MHAALLKYSNIRKGKLKMKIYDFDAKFIEYAQTWMALHPGLTEKQIEQSYNEIMLNFLNAPAKWLNGEKPGEYFNRYDQPKDLMKLVEEYDKRDIGLPEPLYARIVAMGEACAPQLTRIASDSDKPESIRASAIAMLRDIGTDAPRALFVDLASKCKEPNELSEMASDILSASDESVVDELLSRYETAPEYAQMLILDVCCNFPQHEGLFDLILNKLRNRPDDRAYYASLLGKLGDVRAIEPLKSFLTLSDLTYLDYIELRNAIESLGGDAGDERTFYGDPDYEAMRNI